MYIELCNDECWQVRKGCAEAAVTVSLCCPQSIQTTLASVFGKFLTDEKRWVRMSAFQALGLFISTFANPTIITKAENTYHYLVVLNSNMDSYR